MSYSKKGLPKALLGQRAVKAGKAPEAQAQPKRLAVYVSSELFVRTKVAAAEEGTSMSEIVALALEKYLGTPSKLGSKRS